MRRLLVSGDRFVFEVVNLTFKLFDMFFQNLERLALRDQHLTEVGNLLFLMGECFFDRVELFFGHFNRQRVELFYVRAGKDAVYADAGFSV